METFSALLALCAGNSPVPVNSPHKGQWRRALMFSLIYAWIHDWVNNREAGDLRRQRGHYDVIVMLNTEQYWLCGRVTSPQGRQLAQDYLYAYMFHSKSSLSKLEGIQKRALRFVLYYYTPDYVELHEKANVPGMKIMALRSWRLRFTCKNGINPKYLNDLLLPRNVNTNYVMFPS